MSTPNERRPRRTEGDETNLNGWAATSNGSAPTDIIALASHEWRIWMDGWAAGRESGIDHGRQLEHDEVATIQRECVRIVREMAAIPPRDAEADRAAAARRDARWNK